MNIIHLHYPTLENTLRYSWSPCNAFTPLFAISSWTLKFSASQLLSDPGSYWESIRFSIWFCYLGLKSQFTFRYTKYNCMNVWIASTRPTKRWMNIRYKNDFVIEWWVGSLQLALVIHFWVSESVVWDERSSINLSQSFPWLLEGSRGV